MSDTVMTLGQLLKDAERRGVKPYKDAKGHEYMTLVVEKDGSAMYLEPTTEADMKIARAITPKKDLKK